MRVFTNDEVREQFLAQVRGMIDYWDELPKKTTTERLEGLAFSILADIDGCGPLPSFILAPSPHEDDKAYHQSNGSNWFPFSPEHPHDIGGALHEQLKR